MHGGGKQRSACIMSRESLLLLLFCCWIVYVSTEKVCIYKDNNCKQVDLSNLTKSVTDPYRFALTDGSGTLEWNICGAVSCGQISNDTTSACITNKTGVATPLGYLSSINISKWDSSSEDLKITYDGGRCKDWKAQFMVVLSCSNDTTPVITGASYLSVVCSWVVKMKTKTACLSGGATTTTGGGTTSTTGGTTTTTTGGGTGGTTTTTGGTTGGTTTTTGGTTGGGTTSTTTGGGHGTTTSGSTTGATTTTSGGGHGSTTTTSGSGSGSGGRVKFKTDSETTWIITVSILSIIIIALIGIIIGMWWHHRRARTQHEFWREFTEY